MLLIITIIFGIWFAVGAYWYLDFGDSCKFSNYTTKTIIIGGPFWWIGITCELIYRKISSILKKNKIILKPEMKREKNKN